MSRTITDGVPVLPEAALHSLAHAMRDAIAAGYGSHDAAVTFEAPRRPEFGDFSTNAALTIARSARQAPQVIAADLIPAVHERLPRAAELFSDLTAVGGFINVRLAPAVWQNALSQMLAEGPSFGAGRRSNKRISLEFGSANPTGPLVVVQGRTCSIGGALANTMRLRGYDVFVEWIINDAGSQLETLGRSLYARYRQTFDPAYPFPDDGYPGDYLIPLAEDLARRDGDRWIEQGMDSWLPAFSQYGRDRLVAQQQQTAERFGVRFDLWQSERELHEGGAVADGIQRLIDDGATYEREGAVYFRATEYGDDKDRVLVRSDGRPTYLCADVAYHYDKLRRSDLVIDILGPDHHGYIGRLKGLAQALGFRAENLDVLIAQQITLMRAGEEVSMSKRAGHILTLDEILDEVGVDAARFFFVMMAPESPLTFDLALAKEQSNENPVYYVQYGHARIASVLRNADAADVDAARAGQSLSKLRHPCELALIRRLAELPRLLDNVIEHLAPHRLTRYARDVASDFHQFYTECRILALDREERLGRLSLCLAAQQVLAKVLNLVGVNAPDSM